MLRLATRSLIPPPPLATHLTVQPGAARQSEELFCAPQRPEAPQFPHKHVSTATSPTRGTRATSKWPQVSPWQLAVKTAAGLGMDRGALRSPQRTASFTGGGRGNTHLALRGATARSQAPGTHWHSQVIWLHWHSQCYRLPAAFRPEPAPSRHEAKSQRRYRRTRFPCLRLQYPSRLLHPHQRLRSAGMCCAFT